MKDNKKAELTWTQKICILINSFFGVVLCEDDSCPGCGCFPGDGKTEGCTHPQGCGAPEPIPFLKIGKHELEEVGGGDNFTAYQLVDSLQLYLFEDGSWEIQDMEYGFADSSENAVLRGSPESKEEWLESVIYHYRNK